MTRLMNNFLQKVFLSYNVTIQYIVNRYKNVTFNEDTSETKMVKRTNKQNISFSENVHTDVSFFHNNALVAFIC